MVKKGLTSSYLGVTCHFFSRRDHRRHCVTLAVRRMPSPHTADHVRELVDAILEEWDIPISKVKVVVTDNGSNMVAAFRTYLAASSEDDGDDLDDDLDDDSEGDDYGSEVSCEDDFDECELEHDQAFTQMKRIGCFTHTLQLVALTFDNYVGFKELLKRTHDLIHN